MPSEPIRNILKYPKHSDELSLKLRAGGLNLKPLGKPRYKKSPSSTFTAILKLEFELEVCDGSAKTHFSTPLDSKDRC